ncbi:hypothetical protein [Dyadobacter bucti]|uniref:hypothetical protein n=1 Tax=Dyadobacter bucti TaxID=2572203 RepID=UPI003F6EB2C8
MSVDLKYGAHLASGSFHAGAVGFGAIAGVAAVAAAVSAPTVVGGISAGTIAVAAGATAGVGELLSWGFEQLSLDPPRNDYDTVSKTKIIKEMALKKSQDPTLVFIKTSVHLSKTIDNLVISFERYDGARIALRSNTLESNKVVYWISKQRESISHNSLVAFKLLDRLLTMRDQVNVYWKLSILPVLKSLPIEANPMNPRDAFKKMVSDNKSLFIELYQSEVYIDKILERIPEKASDKQTLPDDLISDAQFYALRQLQKSLTKFIPSPGKPTNYMQG